MLSGNDGNRIPNRGGQSGVRGHPRGGDNGPSRRTVASPATPMSTGRVQRSSWPERRRSKVAGGARGYPHPCLATAPRVPATSGTQLRSLPQETRATPPVPGPTADEATAAAAITAAVEAAMARRAQGSREPASHAPFPPFRQSRDAFPGTLKGRSQRAPRGANQKPRCGSRGAGLPYLRREPEGMEKDISRHASGKRTNPAFL